MPSRTSPVSTPRRAKDPRRSDEDNALAVQILDGFLLEEDPRFGAADGNLRVGIHLRPQPQSAILDFDADLDGARDGIQFRTDARDSRGKSSSGNAWCG